MKRITSIAFALGLLLTGCSAESSEITESSTVQETADTTDNTEASEAEPETEHATAPQEEVGYEGMTAVYADSVADGDYIINVDSSSTMFKIAECVLHVSGSEMTADLIINSQSYDYLFMGTGSSAENAAASELISYTVNDEGQSVFTVPVEALDCEVQCAALSAKKQEWYDRTLVFRADSLPVTAFGEGYITTVTDLGLADGIYSVEVTLEGGSGRAYVWSPAELTVQNGEASAHIIWSSSSYDYMIVDGEKYLPETVGEYSEFDIPVSGFDYKMPVSADTTAMSVPYEIEYTLYFDSSTIKAQE
ncbi:MAG: hypothetical protein IJ874_06965 [Ruminococcus sp.]|nr:hypothetical protein [Ruminococcus sp.]